MGKPNRQRTKQAAANKRPLEDSLADVSRNCGSNGQPVGQLPDICTTIDLANRLGVSPQTITRNATRHRIGRKVGRQWLFSPDEAKRLADLLQRNSQRDWSAMGKTGMAKRWKDKS